MWEERVVGCGGLFGGIIVFVVLKVDFDVLVTVLTVSVTSWSSHCATYWSLVFVIEADDMPCER